MCVLAERTMGARITGTNEKTGRPQITKYDEEKIGKTIYCVTSIYNGDIDFEAAMEDLLVKKVLRMGSADSAE